MQRNPNKEYMESNVWKCEKSPTGAHYWVESLNLHGIFICKWCAKHERFPSHLKPLQRDTGGRNF